VTARPLDPRRHAYRADLAAEALRGNVVAARYVSGTPARIARASVPLRKTPVATAALETEALHGEAVTVFDIAGGGAWVQLEADRYVGYLPADTLAADAMAATHRIRAIGTFVYAVPDIKSPPVLHLSLNALIAVAGTADPFYRLASGGYVIARHVAELSWRDRDFVDVAERFIGAPYLWGGWSSCRSALAGSQPLATATCSAKNWARPSRYRLASKGSSVATCCSGQATSA
jgi:cell wall-associated NlpC family hydrolase